MRLLQLFERRLDELTDVGGIEKYTSEELEYELMQKGWKVISDDSYYSNVFGKDSSPWVVKILRNPKLVRPMSDGGLGDSAQNFVCAMKWYRYCLQNWESNPHIPRIPFVKTLDEGDGSRSYVVLIEKLKAIDLSTYKWKSDEQVANIATWSFLHNLDFYTDRPAGMSAAVDMTIIESILRLIPNKVVLKSLFDMFASGGRQNFAPALDDDQIYSWLASRIPGHESAMGMMINAGMAITNKFGNPLAQAYTDIKAMSGANGCLMDLHDENIMVRPSTNELVITDPVQG